MPEMLKRFGESEPASQDAGGSLGQHSAGAIPAERSLTGESANPVGATVDAFAEPLLPAGSAVEPFFPENSGSGTVQPEKSAFSARESAAQSSLAENGKGGDAFFSAKDDDDEAFSSENDFAADLPENEESYGGVAFTKSDESFFSSFEQGGKQHVAESEAGVFVFHNQAEPSSDTAAALKQSRFLGVRLRGAGQVFFFPDNHLPVRVGSKLILEVEQDLCFGEVVTVFFSDAPATAEAIRRQTPGRVSGLATAQDIALHTENSILADEARAFCITCIRQHSLEMKLVDVEVLHDGSKIIFYFTAPSRIDFRELVKDLVRNYRTRIELRQIGVRHETQMIGGIGNCGMVCCCQKYLRKFAPVTIKMAKEQNLFLNPSKLSGMCGRLLCCLSFEQGNYEEFNRRCPKLGKRYATSAGMFKVTRANMFTRSIVICSDAREEREISLDEWENILTRRQEIQATDPQGGECPRGAPTSVFVDSTGSDGEEKIAVDEPEWTLVDGVRVLYEP